MFVCIFAAAEPRRTGCFVYFLFSKHHINSKQPETKFTEIGIQSNLCRLFWFCLQSFNFSRAQPRKFIDLIRNRKIETTIVSVRLIPFILFCCCCNYTSKFNWNVMPIVLQNGKTRQHHMLSNKTRNWTQTKQNKKEKLRNFQCKTPNDLLYESSFVSLPRQFRTRKKQKNTSSRCRLSFILLPTKILTRSSK